MLDKALVEGDLEVLADGLVEDLSTVTEQLRGVRVGNEGGRGLVVGFLDDGGGLALPFREVGQAESRRGAGIDEDGDGGLRGGGAAVRDGDAGGGGPGLGDGCEDGGAERGLFSSGHGRGHGGVGEVLETGGDTLQEPDVHGAEVKRLAGDVEVSGAHERHELDGLHGVAAGNKGKRVDGLVAHLGSLDVRADGVRDVGQLGHVGGHRDVNTLHGEREGRVVGDKVGGQTVVVVGVDQLGGLSEDELTDHLQAETGLLHGGGDGSGLEVGSTVDLAVDSVDERVVAGRVELGGDLAVRKHEVLELGSDPLGNGAPGVAVLDETRTLAVLLALNADGELRALQQGEDVAGTLDLTVVGTGGLDERVERLGGTGHGLNTHGRKSLHEDGELVRLMQSQAGNTGRNGSTVDQTETLLGTHGTGLDAGLAQSIASGHDTGGGGSLGVSYLDKDVGAALDGTGDVGKRHQISRGGDGATQRNDGRNAVLQQLQETIEHLDGDGGVTTGIAVGTDGNGGTNPGKGHRVRAGRGRVGGQVFVGRDQNTGLGELQQRSLKRGSPVRTGIGTSTEASVDT